MELNVWCKFTNNEGREYFYDEVKGEAVVAASGGCGRRGAHDDEARRAYYFNCVTEETTWERPAVVVSPPSPAAAAAAPDPRVGTKQKWIVRQHSGPPPNAAIASLHLMTQREIAKLVKIVEDIWEASGRKELTFRDIASDERIENAFQNLGKTLRAAKKKGAINYDTKGVLFVGRHDDVVVATTKMARMKAAGRVAVIARRRSIGAPRLPGGGKGSLTEAYFKSLDRIKGNSTNQGSDPDAVTEDEWANY